MPCWEEVVALLVVPRAALLAPQRHDLDEDRPWAKARQRHRVEPQPGELMVEDVLDTGPRANWSPDTRAPLGAFVKAAIYVLTIVGWALSLLAVAAFSGLVRSH